MATFRRYSLGVTPVCSLNTSLNQSALPCPVSCAMRFICHFCVASNSLASSIRCAAIVATHPHANLVRKEVCEICRVDSQITCNARHAHARIGGVLLDVLDRVPHLRMNAESTVA